MPPTDERTVEGIWRGEPAHFRDDRLLISVRRTASVRGTLESIRSTFARELVGLEFIRRPPNRWALLQFAPLANAGERIPAIADSLAARRELAYAEPDFAGQTSLQPNDPHYIDETQYWPKQVEIEGMWGATNGRNQVLLAIFDSGVCLPNWSSLPQHADLHSPRFITRHTIVGMLISHNYAHEDEYLFSLFPRDGRGHGTHVAGIAAATGNNSLGVAGANWKSPVYIARVVNNSGVVYVGDLQTAVADLRQYIDMLWPMGIFWPSPIRVVINMSFGFQNYSAALRQICQTTRNDKFMICAAAGARGTSMTALDYPAAFASEFDHVMAVGATTSTRDGAIEAISRPVGMSNYDAITLFAPGVDILSTIPPYSTPDFPAAAPNAYATANGTSIASPIVAGAVSLLWSLDLRLRPIDIRENLREIAVMVPGSGGRYPRLNLNRFRRVRRRYWFWPWW